MKYPLYILFFTIIHCTVHAQKLYYNIDSLVNNIGYVNSIKCIDSLLNKEAEDAYLYNARACITVLQSYINDDNNNKAAIPFYSKAIELDSTNPSYFANRGWSYQQLNKYALALNDFKKAVLLDSNNVNYHAHVLRVLWLQNKNKLAMHYTNTLIEKFPDDGYAYYVRGNLKRDYLHKYPEGNVDIKKSEQLGWRMGFHLEY